jgi:hypothetical protein
MTNIPHYTQKEKPVQVETYADHTFSSIKLFLLKINFFIHSISKFPIANVVNYNYSFLITAYKPKYSFVFGAFLAGSSGIAFALLAEGF